MDSQFKNAKPLFIVSNVWNEVSSQLVDISMPSSYLFDNKLLFMGILTYTKEILSSWNDRYKFKRGFIGSRIDFIPPNFIIMYVFFFSPLECKLLSVFHMCFMEGNFHKT